MTLGDQRAPVTMTEFADLQCPFCREYALEALPTIVKDYVRTGKVRLVFQNLSCLGDDSVTAGKVAAAAAAQNHLWDFIDLFYRNQGTENTGYVTPDLISSIITRIPGLDVVEARKYAQSDAAGRYLQDANQEAQGSRSTPRPRSSWA